MTDPVPLDVEVRGVGVRWGGVTVLDEVDLVFEAGRVTAVMGPSGSGKTTLLTVVAGVQDATLGEVSFGTGDPGPPRIGLVHQAFALLSLLTAAENVELAAQLAGVARGRIRAAAGEQLAAVGLAERADHLVEELSGGEQQRVALARALVVSPRVLLADEPTAQLDAAGRTLVLELLRRAADDGVTVVVATHDPDVAAACDRVVTLAAGRVVTGSGAATGRHRRT